MASNSMETRLGQETVDAVARSLSLGDERLDRRALRMLKDCLASSKSSLSAMFGGSGMQAAKAAQVFLSNPHAGVSDLRQALYALSLEQLQQGPKTVVCAFDPTLLDFSHQSWKSGRMPIGDGRGQGYEWLNSVLVDPQSDRLLGVVQQTLVSKSGPDDRDELEYAPGVEGKRLRSRLLMSSANQFMTHARAVDARLPPGVELVHVADREFDDGLVLRDFFGPEGRSHFVIRGSDRRIVQVHQTEWLPAEFHRFPSQFDLDDGEPDTASVALKDVIEHLPLQGTKELALDGRGRVCPKGVKPARTVKLGVGAVAIRLARQSKRGIWSKAEEKSVWLNLVVVREPDPPPGKKRIQWLLLTDLPVSTVEEMLRVSALYECRWRIEEFFRTAKAAVGLERSELDDPESTARLLVFLTFKVLLLDELRRRAEIPAGVPPTSEQRKELVAGADLAKKIEKDLREHNVPVPSLTRRQRGRMALGLIARHGCWYSASGVSLGNEVLLRGLPLFLHDLSEGRYAWLLDE